jgi:hypothetical protein
LDDALHIATLSKVVEPGIFFDKNIEGLLKLIVESGFFPAI